MSGHSSDSDAVGSSRAETEKAILDRMAKEQTNLRDSLSELTEIFKAVVIKMDDYFSNPVPSATTLLEPFAADDGGSPYTQAYDEPAAHPRVDETSPKTRPPPPQLVPIVTRIVDPSPEQRDNPVDLRTPSMLHPFDAHVHGDSCVEGKCFNLRPPARPPHPPVAADVRDTPPSAYDLPVPPPRQPRRPRTTSEASASTVSGATRDEESVNPTLPPTRYGPRRKIPDEDVVDAPVSTIGINNSLPAITPYTTVSDWVAGAALMLAPFEGAPRRTVVGVVAKALVPRPFVLKAWVRLCDANKSDDGDALLTKLAAETLDGDVVRAVEPTNKIAYPKYDDGVAIVYYLDTFQSVAEANALPDVHKASACITQLHGAALMIAREFFGATKGEPTFTALRKELVDKIDFKQTRADKIRFGRLKLKPGQTVKGFVQELRMEATKAYGTEEGFSLHAIEVRIYEQFLAGLTGDLKNVTAATCPPDLDHA